MSFDNVPVPLENVIGEVGGGFKVRRRRRGVSEIPPPPLPLLLLFTGGCCVLPDRHEHPELGQVQHGQQRVGNDQEADG